MQPREGKKILVVDDSAFMRKLVSDFLNSDPSMKVIGTARNGKEACEKVRQLKPDVVTLDIEMPVMNGLDALQEIMKTNPVPVVMLSSTTKKGASNTVLAMEGGAVDFIAKPGGAISLNLHEIKDEIIEKVKAAANVKISTLTNLSMKATTKYDAKECKKLHKTRSAFEMNEKRSGFPSQREAKELFSKTNKTFVMIGTSTGGPRALQEVLTKIPSDLQAPILIVQHMPPRFTKSLADRLDSLCEIDVKEAVDGEMLINGTAYIAPGGKHLTIKKLGTSYFAHVDEKSPLRLGHRPSVDILFESAAQFTDVNCLAVVLTGMGTDGKEGMERLKNNGRTIAIAQSEGTSVVYGMPKAIADTRLADAIVDLDDIPAVIENIVQRDGL